MADLFEGIGKTVGGIGEYLIEGHPLYRERIKHKRETSELQQLAAKVKLAGGIEQPMGRELVRAYFKKNAPELVEKLRGGGHPLFQEGPFVESDKYKNLTKDRKAHQSISDRYDTLEETEELSPVDEAKWAQVKGKIAGIDKQIEAGLGITEPNIPPPTVEKKGPGLWDRMAGGLHRLGYKWEGGGARGPYAKRPPTWDENLRQQRMKQAETAGIATEETAPTITEPPATPKVQKEKMTAVQILANYKKKNPASTLSPAAFRKYPKSRKLLVESDKNKQEFILQAMEQNYFDDDIIAALQ